MSDLPASTATYIPWTVAGYQALVKAHQAGATRVTVEGRTTEYRDRADMMRDILAIKAELEAQGLLTATPVATPIRRVRMIYRKGF